MKLIGVLVCVGLICAASAKLPMANRKYKFYLNRFFSGAFMRPPWISPHIMSTPHNSRKKKDRKR